MATDKPISGFSALSAVNLQSDDILPIVDVHDTAQSSAGSTKTITVAALLSTLPAANLTGDINLGTGTSTVARSTAARFVSDGATPAVSATYTGSVGGITVVGTDEGGAISMLSLSGTYLTASIVFTSAFPTGAAVTVSPGSTAIPSDTYLSAVSKTGFTITFGASGFSSVAGQTIYFTVRGY